MKKYILLICLLIIVFVGIYYISTKREDVVDPQPKLVLPVEIVVEPKAEIESLEPALVASTSKPQFISPLDKPKKRIRLKKFGDFITPDNSPVSPERFRGYHTGADFEVFPEELNGEVKVRAMCDGNIREKKWVNGYGGVVIMDCEINDKPVTVLYGHLNLKSVIVQAQDMLEAGEIVGSLGADNSQETDRERKHLHLSIHQGKTINLKGYVSQEVALDGWLDPCNYICN